MALGGGVTGVTAGCTDTSTAGVGEPSTPSGTDIVAGPNGRFVFEPDRLTVQTGASVTWYFASGGHNVSGRPADSETVTLPAGAQAFSSYDPADSMRSTVPEGETYAHTFEVPGDYVYVCIPHVTAGMTGRIRVTE